jgi:glycosyltransferase involved in cell wall biosynthesis
LKQASRVVIVAPSLDILGGQSVQARSLMDGLRGDGYSVSLLPINPQLPKELQWLRRLRGVRTLLNQAMYVPSLAGLAKADIVHVFSASYWSFLLSPAPAMIAARALNKRVILHYHSGEAADHLTWGPLVHPWLHLAHEIVVPSRYLQEIFAQHGHETRVIANIVDPSWFHFRDRRRLLSRVLCTRNLEPHYRIDIVLEAFARFKMSEPAATLTIAGCGREEAQLRRLARSIAPGAVRFAGKIEPERMPGLYADHDIFVNASQVDNQPVSIIEAFASGLPVVTTAVGDIPNMVRHGSTGLMAQVGDAAGLAEALLATWRDPLASRLRVLRAREEIARFTWAAVRDKWAEIYGEKGLGR